uniref:Capsid protein n=1 Tax=Ficedula parva Genomoviridae sp. TaxID=2814952 RepID=A0A8A4XD44_9VIRU|nr:MAG: capsid protein [Gemycircularvirus]
MPLVRYKNRRSVGRTYRKKAAPRRRSYGKKRAYRKKASTRRSLTDKMATKKRDIMVSSAVTGTNPVPGGAASLNPIRINGATTNPSASGVHMMMFLPTYRYLQPNNAAYIAFRTSSRPYLKGIAETYSFLPNDGSVWYHRRIVVASKFVFTSDIGASQSTSAQAGPGANSFRRFTDLTGQTTGVYQTTWDLVQDQLFQGVKQTDWNDQMTAKVDNTRFTVLQDKRYALTSGNAAPRPYFRKHYVKIEKTIVYDDEENGTSISPSPYSVDSKPGIGNVYVFDLFEAPVPIDTVTSTLSISSTQTLYWHEK